MLRPSIRGSIFLFKQEGGGTRRALIWPADPTATASAGWYRPSGWWRTKGHDGKAQTVKVLLMVDAPVHGHQDVEKSFSLP